MRSNTANETPTPFEREGKFWACYAYPLHPLLLSDVDKPFPWLKIAVFLMGPFHRLSRAERLFANIHFSLIAGRYVGM